ncbi:DNA mismatch repair protein MLH1 [Camellia lanceoleosa]|nr:DNA mismatch repair protein MLH1 [Camellia lanceoleosa]
MRQGHFKNSSQNGTNRFTGSCREVALHAYLQVKPPSHHENNSSLTSVRSSIRQRRNQRKLPDLTSVQELIDDIDNKCHSVLLDIVRHCTYIGMADDVFALLQHNTHLFLANVHVLHRFAHFNAIQLSDPAPLPELIKLALKEEDVDPECNEKDEMKEKIAERNIFASMLIHKATCLGFLSYLTSTHLIWTGSQNLYFVWEMINVVVPKVDWGDEKSCFQSIAAALGNFYAMHPPLLPNPSEDRIMEDENEHELISKAETAWAQREWSIQHVLFPSMRLFFRPPTSMATNGTFVQVLSTLVFSTDWLLHWRNFTKFLKDANKNSLVPDLMTETTVDATYLPGAASIPEGWWRKLC